MSNISNRFYVTALSDGTTLHGNLSVVGSITQSWNGTTAVPDWSIAANQPIIYVTLMSGNQAVLPSNTFNWSYNGEVIEFDSNGNSTNFSGLFRSTTYSYVYDNVSYTMPALKITDNLASSSNVDIDTIMFSGEYVESGSSLPFSASIQARISVLTEGSSLGVINFVNGKSDITQQSDEIVMYGVLYNSEGVADGSATTKWYLNDSVTPTSGTTISGKSNAFKVTGEQVVDHATIRCEFYVGASLAYTAYAYVDDMQDPQFMYIQYNGNNGNAASLRKGETATFQIWVGTRDDAGVLGGASTPTYPIIKVQLLNGSGTPIMTTGLATNIPDPDANGYRTLPMSGGKGTITPHYDTVNSNGKNLTGIVIAYTN